MRRVAGWASRPLLALLSASLAIAACEVPMPDARASDGTPVYGLSVNEIPTSYRRRTGFSGGGAYVVRIAPGSPAEQTRILPGDIITRLDATSIANASAFDLESTAILEDEATDVAIVRYGRPLTLTMSAAAKQTPFDPSPACDPGRAGKLMTSASAAGRAHDADLEALEAEHALNAYAGCVAKNGVQSGQNVLKIADALLLQGAARTLAGHGDEALSFLVTARSVYRYLTSTRGIGSEIVAAARHKSAIIEASVPATRDSSPPPDLLYAIVPPPPKPAPPKNEDTDASVGDAADAQVSVVTTWSSPGVDPDRLVHIRVRLHPSRSFTFVPQGFQVRVVSPTSGSETIAAYDHPAGSYRGVNYGGAAVVVDKVDVLPIEDFGARGAVTVRAGDEARLVLTFAVPSDANLKDVAKSLAYHLQ